MEHAAVLEAIGVSKRYGQHEALSRVNLVAEPGQLHGLLGPNGAGKTTLMRVLLGLVRRDAGTVRIFGREIDESGGVLPDGVAGSIESPAFYPYLSGWKNLAALGRLDGLTGSELRRRVDDALGQTGLTAQASVAAGAYSAGMRQRLGVAAALIRAPRLIFLDEPTSALDPAGARDVRVLARRLASLGAAVVLSSHDMAEVEDLCAVVTVIDRGRVVFSGTIGLLRTLAPASTCTLHTSDDALALTVGSSRSGLTVIPLDGGALDVSGSLDALDAYMIALGRAGVAVRHLESRSRSLESVFFALTGAPGEPVTADTSTPGRS